MLDGPLGHELIAVAAYLAALGGLFAARRRLGTFASVGLFTAFTVAYLRLGFQPAIPGSALALYLAVFGAAVLLYVTSSEELSRATWGPIRRTMVEPARLPVLLGLMVAIPALVAFRVYAKSLPSGAPPPRIRSVHPAPPTTISFQPPGSTEAKTINVLRDRSPYRQWEESEPEAFREKVAHGKVVYYENCFFCHGDTLAGDGHLAGAVKPPPANFQDKGTIAQLEETFLFWRIAKGGPGLPEEATPFDSSMPAWEKFLTEDDIWSTVLFVYDYTGTRPRTQEALHETGEVPDHDPSPIQEPGKEKSP